MGQYHKLVNLDKKEVVHPHSIGMGAKQYEHTGYEGSLSDAMYLLMMTSPARGGGDWIETDVSGRWVGDRVVVVGDYTEDSDLPFIPNGKEVYHIADSWEDISSHVREAFARIFPITYEQTTYGWKASQVS